MAEKYRLTIEKIEDELETLLIVEGPKAIVAAALSFAPAALGEAEVPAPAAPVNASGPYGEQQTDDDKPKRTRRTKAQMDADRVAEAAGAQSAPASPVAAEAGEETTAPLDTPISYAPPVPPAAEPTSAPYNPFGPK